MIRLNRNPFEGSAVKVNISFRDSFGAYYVPSELTYTFLALNEDEESWSIVGDYYKVKLEPASSVNLTIPDIKIIEGTKLQRKIIIEWSGYVDGEYTDFKDEVNFDVEPMPYITDLPPDPEPSEVYIEITDVSLQVGSLSTAPVMPVFKVRTSLPVILTDALIQVKDESGNTINCNTTIDSTYTLLTIVPERRLEFTTPYSLFIDNLKCKIGEYVLKEPFIVNFVTEFSSNFLEIDKEVVVSENGVTDIVPSSGYDGIANVILTTAIPIQDEKTVEVETHSSFDVEPDDGYTAIKKVHVDVNLPIQRDKEETVYANGTYVIAPDGDYTSMLDATVHVNIPVDGVKEIEANENGVYNIRPDVGKSYMEGAKVTVNVPIQEEKDVVVSSDGTVEIVPDTGFTAIKKVNLTVATGGTVALYAYGNQTGDIVFYVPKRIVSTGVYQILAIPSLTVDEGFKNYTVYRNGTNIEFEYNGVTQSIARDSSKDIMR